MVKRAIGAAGLGEASDPQGEAPALRHVAGDYDLAVTLRGHGADLEALRERRDAVLSEGSIERRGLGRERCGDRYERDPRHGYPDQSPPTRGDTSTTLVADEVDRAAG